MSQYTDTPSFELPSQYRMIYSFIAVEIDKYVDSHTTDAEAVGLQRGGLVMLGVNDDELALLDLVKSIPDPATRQAEKERVALNIIHRIFEKHGGE